MKLTGSQIRNIMDLCEGSSILTEAVKPEKILNSAAAQATNLAKKATMAYLHKAWEDAGRPTDSTAIANVLKKAGVKAGVVSSVYQTLKIDSSPQATNDTIPFEGDNLTVKQISQMIDKLRTRDAQSLLKHVSKLVNPTAPSQTQPKAKPATQASQPKAKQSSGKVEPTLGDLNVGNDEKVPSVSTSDTDVAPVKGINAQRGKQTRTPKVKEQEPTKVEPTVSEPMVSAQSKEKAALTQPKSKKAALLRPGKIAQPPQPRQEKPAVLRPKRPKPSI